MVPLPLFKLAALFVRHISKYGANRIKKEAHEHVGFRRFAARYGQAIHQLNMRLQVSVLRNSEAQKKLREKAEQAEAPTVKTKEQTDREEREKRKAEADRAKYGTTAKESHPVTASASALLRTSVWRRQFRPLPEAKAVDLFADVAGDAFILIIASVLLLYEYYRSAGKPDANLERIRQLRVQVDELEAADAEHIRREEEQETRLLALETALRAFHDPKTKKPLLPLAPPPEVPLTEEDPVESAPTAPPAPAPVVSPPA